MNTTIVAILIALFGISCGSDSTPTAANPTPTPEPTTLPKIPIPSSPTDALPAMSDYVDVGLSSPLPSFIPVVATMNQMQDDGTMLQTTENRRLKLVCGGTLAECSCDPTVPDPTYVSESPRLLHRRYWRRLRQVVMDPGTEYSHQETITYGNSTTNTVSQSFSQTIGVEVSASGGWGPFSAEVKASYSQTTTREEINAVTFSEEHSFTDTYSVPADPNKVIVYGLWQLVDAFVLTDAKKTPINLSNTLVNVTIPAIQEIDFPNKDVIYQSITKFSPTS